MPIQYGDSVIESSLHCRKGASLFDVSHMCGIELTGPGAIPFVESIVVADVQALEDGNGSLTVILNESGGIIDDAIVTKLASDKIYMVLNAGCRDKDLAHIRAQLDKFTASADAPAVELSTRDDRALLALQGPASVEALQPLAAADLSRLYFGQLAEIDLDGSSCYVARSGYTGEDGFELSVPANAAVAIAERLLLNDQVRLAGLGARDALRLEAGLCLYGNDIDEQTNPVDAALLWTIGKRRRLAFDFVGGEPTKKAIEAGASRRRVGLVSKGPPARHGSNILDLDGNVVGQITSGTFSPTLKKNIAMGYVPKGLWKAGTELQVEVRGKKHKATVEKMPFVPTNYYKQ